MIHTLVNIFASAAVLLTLEGIPVEAARGNNSARIRRVEIPVEVNKSLNLDRPKVAPGATSYESNSVEFAKKMLSIGDQFEELYENEEVPEHIKALVSEKKEYFVKQLFQAVSV